MSGAAHPDDPRGLIGDAYRIEGLGVEDARSIFFDWALGLPEGTDQGAAAARLLEAHAGEPAEHPMTRLLAEAVAGPAAAGRRRGRRPREEG